MNTATPVVQIENLSYSYGTAEALDNFTLSVPPGKCYGLFGRNGAGKTTTMKCLLNLLQPQKGQVRVFGLDPAKAEVAVKRRLAYVPDQVAFYPWMTVRETLDYLASFRDQWNADTERELLGRFHLDVSKKAGALSKGQRTQLGLIAAICPEPDLLVLDEPTSGLDPIVRREFIETVIGAYQEGNPGRTILVSTHLIAEFEGLIDAFTIVDRGRAIVALDADQARERYKKIRARFAAPPPDFDLSDALRVRREGREIEVVVDGASASMMQRFRERNPEDLSAEALTLEEIFVATLQ